MKRWIRSEGTWCVLKTVSSLKTTVANVKLLSAFRQLHRRRRDCWRRFSQAAAQRRLWWPDVTHGRNRKTQRAVDSYWKYINVLNQRGRIKRLKIILRIVASLAPAASTVDSSELVHSVWPFTNMATNKTHQNGSGFGSLAEKRSLQINRKSKLPCVWSDYRRYWITTISLKPHNRRSA